MKHASDVAASVLLKLRKISVSTFNFNYWICKILSEFILIIIMAHNHAKKLTWVLVFFLLQDASPMYAYETQEVQHLSASLTLEWSSPISVGIQAFCRSFKRMYVSTTVPITVNSCIIPIITLGPRI